MAFVDNKLVFSTSWTSAQTITATADSTNVVDVIGSGVNTVPAIIPTVAGYDIGLGNGVIPWVMVNVTAVNGAPSANTLTVALKAAPDSGTGTEGTYTQLYVSTSKAENLLVKGDYLLFQVPPTLFEWPSEALPRFYKLTYTAGGGNLAGLGVVAGILLNPPSSLIEGSYQSNFTVV